MSHGVEFWWALGAVLALLVAGAAYAAHALTRGGTMAAWMVGTVVFGVGHWPWAAALLAFFGTSSALSRWRKGRKEGLGWEKTGRRDGRQVWANGGATVLCALLPLLVPGVSHARAHLLFLAALAAANADTWATEIGAAFGGSPRLVTTGRSVPRGTSGAVSAAGTLAALGGAALLGLFAIGDGLTAVLIVTGAGLAGSLFDSVLGATAQAQWRDVSGRLTEQVRLGETPVRGWRWVGNDLVNVLCTFSSVALASLLLTFLPAVGK